MYTMICKSYNCHNCGTELNKIRKGNIFRCPYCGATYIINEISDVAVEIEQTKEGLDVLNVKKIINNEFIDYLTNKDELENIIKKTICDDLVKELLNYIELEKEEDPNRYQTVYTAKIRLPKIDYKF